jgi:hypothetical protein
MRAVTTQTAIVLALLLGCAASAAASGGEVPRELIYPFYPPAPASQSQSSVDEKSQGCQSCHVSTDSTSMHDNPAVMLGCTDCHGGDASVEGPEPAAADSAPYSSHPNDAGHAQAAEEADVTAHGATHGDTTHHDAASKFTAPYLDALEKAHVLPRYPHTWGWPSSRTPERTYTLLNRESPEFIRFMNPGDLRVARESCGACHADILGAVERSLMANMAMFWGGAAYNNGIVPFKRYLLGEAYTRDGEPAAVKGMPGDDTPEALAKGHLPILYPMPAWETVPPGDNFRVFERGGRNIASTFPEIGLPNPFEEPGKPDIRQSNRGPGTGSRVSIPVLNIHKTRLNDPALWFQGTNDQPGDYRSSGCSSCHVVYANDREPLHSGPLSAHGHSGTTITKDPTIPKNESGHPLRHVFTRSIPTSTCMVCHMHQPNMFVNSYLGFTMWDYEADAPLMYPSEQRRPTDEEMFETYERNPEGAVVRGKWSDLDFLKKVWTDVNPKAEMTQFADYHGHGWNFRAVFKRDRKGNLLDADGGQVEADDPDKFKKAVHMRDIHAEKGMHCVDCHFSRDSHGTGHITAEVAASVEVRCRDCHGTVDATATLRSSGPAAPDGGSNFALIRNPDGRLRFEWRDGVLLQRSLMWPDREWAVPQVKDTVTPGHADYNAKAARAKTMSRSNDQRWGEVPAPENRAHRDDNMACFSCHSSWVTSCGGCHLPINANRKTERHHFEGGETRNYATYNPQVLRDQLFMLGRHSQVKGGIIAPLRSSSALVVSSSDINRNHIYVQQPPVSSSGYSSQAINPHFPHTVRRTETKQCEDCHLSTNGDNNAIMAQLLGLGTNFINMLGFNAWVGTEASVEAVQVTEWDEPQAVLGSYLHRYAYPDDFQRHVQGGLKLDGRETEQPATTHHANDVRCIQARGEYLFSAQGEHGMQVYDIANVANKAFSERIVTGPFSPLGHDTHVESSNATCVALPTTQPIRYDRNGSEPGSDAAHLMREVNLEQPMHPIYKYAAITDSEEGLILTDVVTLGDFEPRNNFLKRDVVWNPNGLLNGARFAQFAGHLLYVAAQSGVVIVDLNDPTSPVHLATIPVDDARAVFVQFRYLFITSAKGLEIADITNPDAPTLVSSSVPLTDARGLFVARTYAYVAAGAEGLIIVDVERPEHPTVVTRYTGHDGAAPTDVTAISDATDVTVATTNGSLFAYVADGNGGLKVIQLTSPDSQPNMYGFSPEPRPELIAWHRTEGRALSISRPLERDRAVDETGHQVAVFGRVGSRPFNQKEMREFFLGEDGLPWTVRNEEQPAGSTSQ